jgi:hypothetical protein
VLRERGVGESLWEAVLPAELRQLPLELAKIVATGGRGSATTTSNPSDRTGEAPPAVVSG